MLSPRTSAAGTAAPGVLRRRGRSTLTLFLVWGAVLTLFPPSSSAARSKPRAGTSLEVFAGSASKPATEEASKRFEAATGVRVNLHFGGSGAVLSQMVLAGRGDIYLPGSSDFMEIAKNRGLVDPATEVRLVYLLPAISVPKGNPKNIQRLEDLAKPGMRVGIARPETVCVGLYGVEILLAAGLADAVRPNLVTQTESCTRTAQILSLGLVDAVLGWDVFDDWAPHQIQTIDLPPERVVRIGYIPAAVSSFSREPELSRTYLAFLAGAEAKEIFRRHGYLVDLEAARRLATPTTPVGGEFALPESWR